MHRRNDTLSSFFIAITVSSTVCILFVSSFDLLVVESDDDGWCSGGVLDLTTQLYLVELEIFYCREM